MNIENRPGTYTSGAELTSSPDTSDENTDVVTEKCICSENSTCEYCCIQEYQKALFLLRQKTLTSSRSGGAISDCSTTYEIVDEQEEFPDYTDELECDIDEQSNGENADAQSMDRTRNISFQSQDKPKVNWNTDFRYVGFSDYNSDSEETKDADFAFDLRQPVENFSGDKVTKDPDYSLEMTSGKTGAETCDTDIGSHNVLDASYVIDQMDSDTNTCFSEEMKDLENCCNLEQSNDTKTCNTDSCLKRMRANRTQATEVFTDSVGESCKRTRRNSKRKIDAQDSCPVCGLTIRSCELKSHFDKEVENLSKIQKNARKVCGGTGVNTTFVQVKSNRENRLAAKIAKYTKKTVKHVECPVCCLRLNGSEEENNEHVLNCFQDSDIDILERDDSFEEYEFGNETRVRAISLVPGGYRALHGHSSNSKADENDEDLNVDVDDTLQYGKPQYTELDVIHNLTDAEEIKQLEQLRRAVIDPTAEPKVLESRKWTNSIENEKSEVCSFEKSAPEEDIKSDHLISKTESDVQDTIVSSLKEKIKNLEDQSKNVKCLICLEPYTKPVVSTACWHVYCEECWLMTMGVKKLCPQCNMIVFPSDLRRIYL